MDVPDGDEAELVEIVRRRLQEAGQPLGKAAVDEGRQAPLDRRQVGARLQPRISVEISAAPGVRNGPGLLAGEREIAAMGNDHLELQMAVVRDRLEDGADDEVARLRSRDDQPPADRVGGAEIFPGGPVAEDDVGRCVQRQSPGSRPEGQADKAEEVGIGDQHVLGEGPAVADDGQGRRIGPAHRLDLREILEQRLAHRAGGECDLVRLLAGHRLDGVDPVEPFGSGKPAVVAELGADMDEDQDHRGEPRGETEQVDRRQEALPRHRPQAHPEIVKPHRRRLRLRLPGFSRAPGRLGRRLSRPGLRRRTPN